MLEVLGPISEDMTVELCGTGAKVHSQNKFLSTARGKLKTYFLWSPKMSW